MNMHDNVVTHRHKFHKNGTSLSVGLNLLDISPKHHMAFNKNWSSSEIEIQKLKNKVIYLHTLQVFCVRIWTFRHADI